MPNDKEPKKPIITPPPRLPDRKKRATPGFGEDTAGERITKRVKRDIEKPVLKNET